MIIKSEYRDGNVPAGYRQLENKQCASWFMLKNPFQALQACNLLELPFLCFLRTKNILIFLEKFPRGGSIGDWGQTPISNIRKNKTPLAC